MADSPSTRPGPAAIAAAAVVDTILVLLFAGIGRGSHAREASLVGLWETAWPFLVALAIVWVIALIWRRPTALVRSGIPVWIGTVVIGLVLRVLFTDGGAALPFVLVATGTLGLMLVGWRAIYSIVAVVRRRRNAVAPQR